LKFIDMGSAKTYVLELSELEIELLHAALHSCWVYDVFRSASKKGKDPVEYAVKYINLTETVDDIFEDINKH